MKFKYIPTADLDAIANQIARLFDMESGRFYEHSSGSRGNYKAFRLTGPGTLVVQAWHGDHFGALFSRVFEAPTSEAIKYLIKVEGHGPKNTCLSREEVLHCMAKVRLEQGT